VREIILGLKLGDGKTTCLGALKFAKEGAMKEADLERLKDFFNITGHVPFEDLTKHSLRVPKGRIIPYFWHEKVEYTWRTPWTRPSTVSRKAS
jgi:hypothetical protein